jgi:hypothetical protein
MTLLQPQGSRQYISIQQGTPAEVLLDVFLDCLLC